MNFPQKFQTFLASTAAFFVQMPPTLPQLPSQLEPLLAVQNQQWQNAVIAFCFSYALGVSLQYVSPDKSNHQLPFPLVLLSFLVLLTFIFTLVAFFIHTNCTTSKALQKVALLLAATAFCHTLSIPFSFELKCAIWAVFLLSSVISMTFTYLNTKTA